MYDGIARGNLSGDVVDKTFRPDVHREVLGSLSRDGAAPADPDNLMLSIQKMSGDGVAYET